MKRKMESVSKFTNFPIPREAYSCISWHKKTPDIQSYSIKLMATSLAMIFFLKNKKTDIAKPLLKQLKEIMNENTRCFY